MEGLKGKWLQTSAELYDEFLKVSLLALLLIIKTQHFYFLGTPHISKTDEFLEKLQGGGVIFNPKNYIAKFGPLKRAFSA